MDNDSNHIYTTLTKIKKHDEIIRLIRPYSWVALIAVLVFIILVIIWSFVGFIPITATGKGILLTPNGLYMVESNTSGTIRHIYFQPGDEIQKGDLLMRIYDPEFTDLLKNLALKRSIFKVYQDNLPVYEEDLKLKKKLFSQGLVAADVVLSANQNVMNQQVHIDQTSQEINSTLSTLMSRYNYSLIEGHILDNGEDIDLIDSSRFTNILYPLHSPISGKILSTDVSENEWIPMQQNLFWISARFEPGESLVCWAFFPASQGDKIRTGMGCQISLDSINYSRYGYVDGVVSEVETFPISKKEIQNLLKNDLLAETFVKNASDSYIQAKITLAHDPRTVSGYAWSSEAGPPYPIYAGSVGKVIVRIAKNRPIYYVIPLYRQFVDSYNQLPFIETPPPQSISDSKESDETQDSR